MFKPFFMVRLLTLVLFVPAPIEMQNHKYGKFPNPPGQLTEIVPLVEIVAPEIRSTLLPNATVVVLIAHCDCAGEAIVPAASTTEQNPTYRRSERTSGFHGGREDIAVQLCGRLIRTSPSCATLATSAPSRV